MQETVQSVRYRKVGTTMKQTYHKRSCPLLLSGPLAARLLFFLSSSLFCHHWQELFSVET